jgi:exopolyphosphatase / guanosine-5'-triphosphate,3'-diphosphate pyrophosphatase
MSVAAVIDIGTNSVKLTIAEVEEPLTILKEDARLTRLGKNVDRDGLLDPEAVRSTLEAVQSFADEAKKLGAEAIVAAGTSALRDAKNGQELLDHIRNTTGITVDIIAGEREADLSFLAVSGDPDLNVPAESKLLVFDIGGGSSELTLGSSGIPRKHTSINVGAVRLTERYLKSDPPTSEDWTTAESFVMDLLKEFFSDSNAINLVCGVGGTATTFAAITAGTKQVHGTTVRKDNFEACLRMLAAMTVGERKTMPLLEPERADIIVGGGLILQCLLNLAGCLEFTVSARGMRYGLLLEERNKASKGSA